MIYISGDLFLDIAEGIAPDLKYPRIGYKKIDSTVQGTNTKSGYSADAVKNNYTYERWRSAGAGNIVLDAGEIVDVDYVSIGAHTLSGVSTVVSVSVDGVSYDDVGEFVAGTNNAIMILFDNKEIRYVKIAVGAEAEIGVVYFGKVLVMQRAIYGGHTPITLSRTTEKNIYMSEEGEYLGTRIIRKGFSTDYSFEHLTASWVRNTFDPFVKHAITEPFFIAWRPSSFPKEVVFGWCDADIVPSNMGIRDYMSVSFTVRGYDEL